MPRPAEHETPRPATIPACAGPCKRRGVVLYMGYCDRCTAAEERDKEKNQ